MPVNVKRHSLSQSINLLNCSESFFEKKKKKKIPMNTTSIVFQHIFWKTTSWRNCLSPVCWPPSPLVTQNCCHQATMQRCPRWPCRGRGAGSTPTERRKVSFWSQMTLAPCAEAPGIQVTRGAELFSLTSAPQLSVETQSAVGNRMLCPPPTSSQDVPEDTHQLALLCLTPG